jgi:hypothetical protein
VDTKDMGMRALFYRQTYLPSSTPHGPQEVNSLIANVEVEA